MKRNFYHIFCALFVLLVCAGWAALTVFEIAKTDNIAVPVLLLCLAACCALLRLDSLVHESGHLIFGLLAGLRLRRVAFGWVSFGDGGVRFGSRSVAGETQFSLKKPQGEHAKLIAATVGGPILGIVFGVTMLALYFVLPMHPALTFFTLYALWCLAEGVMELLPAELVAGKTDGLVLKELIQRTGETEVAIRIMQAQLLAKDGDFSRVSRALLYDVPVVRADSPAFSELLKLRAAWCEFFGDKAGVSEAQARLQTIAQED